MKSFLEFSLHMIAGFFLSFLQVIAILFVFSIPVLLVAPLLLLSFAIFL